MENPTEKRVLDIMRERGVLRPKDLDRYGIPRKYLWTLFQKGLLSRIGPGLYALPDAEPTENRTLIEVCNRIPHGTVCLISALQFHGMTSELPFRVWLAVEGKSRVPDEPDLPVKIVWFNGKAFTEGVESHEIEGHRIRIYSPPKTVADCFKYRNKIGKEVAIEALREGLRQRKCGIDDLHYFGGICRVWNVMKPYVEAMV